MEFISNCKIWTFFQKDFNLALREIELITGRTSHLSPKEKGAHLQISSVSLIFYQVL